MLFNRRLFPIPAVVAVALLVTACTSHTRSHGAPTSRSAAITAPSGSVSASTPAAAVKSSTSSSATARADAVSASRPCGAAASGTRYAHVVWIWMENKPYGSVIGSGSAPYENQLANLCGLATNYHGITHPSLPNYLAATGGSTFGVSDDSGPSAHPISGQSLFGQLDAAGLSWRAYEESMPANCDTSAGGRYGTKHNPPLYYTSLRSSCAADDVPLAGNFDRDIAAGSLPSLSFVTPNLCDDTHDCSVRTGDEWLASWLLKILDGANYQAGNTLVVLTWDEGTGSGNQIPTVVVAPSVRPGMRVGARLDHYALLRATEDLLGVDRLGAAASAPSLGAAFGL